MSLTWQVVDWHGWKLLHRRCWDEFHILWACPNHDFPMGHWLLGATIGAFGDALVSRKSVPGTMGQVEQTLHSRLSPSCHLSTLVLATVSKTNFQHVFYLLESPNKLEIPSLSLAQQTRNSLRDNQYSQSLPCWELGGLTMAEVKGFDWTVDTCNWFQEWEDFRLFFGRGGKRKFFEITMLRWQWQH